MSTETATARDALAEAHASWIAGMKRATEKCTICYPFCSTACSRMGGLGPDFGEEKAMREKIQANDMAQPTQSVAASILTEAATIVDGARQQTHGDRERSFGMIAAMWSAYLGVNVNPVDVAVMMALLKVARAKCGDVTARDHHVDGSAYMALAGELAGVE